MDIIEHHRAKLPKQFTLVSEKDNGIYDAMNKGIRQASGKLIGIVNSDDWYEKDTIENVVKAYQGNQYEVVINSDDVCVKKEFCEKYYTGDVQNVTDEEFEKLIGRKLPDKVLKIEDITAENTLEQIKNTAIGKVIYDNQIEKMNRLLREHNVNKATKVMMDLQKPLKKFYEKKSSKITKEMVDELIAMAKKGEFSENNAFVKEYLK